METRAMKKNLTVLVIAFVGIVSCQPAIATVISYELTDWGAGYFQYLYTVENDTLEVPIEQLTIWFDEQLYGEINLFSGPPITGNWDELILPSTGFGVPLGYDAQALGDGIGIGELLGGFSVVVLFNDEGQPGNQFFEIIDPATSHTIDSGYMVPEPATLLLLGLAVLAVMRNRRMA
jgi:hypothetical protein